MYIRRLESHAAQQANRVVIRVIRRKAPLTQSANNQVQGVEQPSGLVFPRTDPNNERAARSRRTMRTPGRSRLRAPFR
jgi:hypothetical protein